MSRVVVHSQVGSDGVLQLTVPLGTTEAGQDVRVTIESVAKPVTQDEWRRRVMKLAGSWRGDLERPEQGEYEQRDQWP
jgi:hypothetical protein